MRMLHGEADVMGIMVAKCSDTEKKRGLSITKIYVNDTDRVRKAITMVFASCMTAVKE